MKKRKGKYIILKYVEGTSIKDVAKKEPHALAIFSHKQEVLDLASAVGFEIDPKEFYAEENTPPETIGF